MFRIGVTILLLSLASAQQISMTVCTDSMCNSNCVSWTTSSGSCAVCQGGANACSPTNPSSITTSSDITLYSDAKCTTRLMGTGKMPITLDNTCHLLHSMDMTPIGSYRATNQSAIIGGVISGIIATVLLTLICLKCCGVKICCCCPSRSTSAAAPPQSTAVIMDSAQANQHIPIEYGQQYVDPQKPVQQAHVPQSYGQTQYQQGSYADQTMYPQTMYPQPYSPSVYAPPSYPGQQTYYSAPPNNWAPPSYAFAPAPPPSAPPSYEPSYSSQTSYEPTSSAPPSSAPPYSEYQSKVI